MAGERRNACRHARLYNGQCANGDVLGTITGNRGLTFTRLIYS